MNLGDIVLVNFPYSDQTGQKVRPVLVVSGERFNRSGDLVVVPISSSPAAGDVFCVLVEESSPVFAQTGLRRSSAIKWTKPHTISRVVVQRRLGSLALAALEVVRERVRSVFEGL